MSASATCRRSASARSRGSDKFTQYALTVEGKIGNFDITYAGAYMDRPNHSTNDYTDYTDAYDAYYESYGGLANYQYYFDNNGDPIDPRQYITGGNHFKKMSQELRIASPADKPFRVIGGAFYQRQSNDILQEYRVDNLADELSVNGRPGLDLADQAKAHRSRLCGLRRSKFRRYAADHADGRRTLVQVRQYRIRLCRLRPRPGLLPGCAGQSAAKRCGQHQDGCRAMLHDERRYVARFAAERHRHDVDHRTACLQERRASTLATFENGKLKPKQSKDDGFTYRFNGTGSPHEGSDVLRHLVQGLPAGRHQPPAGPRAVRSGLPDQL